MSKTLSLKKVCLYFILQLQIAVLSIKSINNAFFIMFQPKPNASKNQKAITQFFKNVSNDVKKSPVKQSPEKTKSDLRICKRKVSSAEQLNVLKDEEKPSKKCKIVNSNVSTEKQNDTLSLKQSSEKLKSDFSHSPEKSVNRKVNNDKQSSCSVDNKSPLMSVSPNSIKNQVKDKNNLDCNTGEEPNINEKENQVCNDIFNNHDEDIQTNNIKFKKSNKSPKKSPNGKFCFTT